MSVQNFKIIKTTPADVLFELHPVSNYYGLSRKIYLTNSVPQQSLPLDWALGVFQSPSVYELYKKGYFTFDNNEGIVKAAYEAGVYFDEKLDFEPAKENTVKEILSVLKSGVRSNINKVIEKYPKDTIVEVAKLNLGSLTQGVVSMLESALNIQLVLDEK